MLKTRSLCAGTILLFTAPIPYAVAAGGTAAHAWVASAGVNDATCGGFASPCGTIQYALDNIVEPGGTISVAGSGSYGVVVIKHAITLIAEGGLAQIFAKTGDAIDVQAGASDNILIRGLSLSSSGSGTNGINVISGNEITIDDCVISGFINGVNVSPSAAAINFTISHSSIVDNRGDGVNVEPSGSSSVVGSIFESNVSYDVNGVFSYPQSAAATSYVTVSGSTVNGNTDVGVASAGTGGSFVVTRTTGVGNAAGASVYNGTTGVGHGYTYGDNRFTKSTSGTDTFGLTTLTGN